MMYLLFVVMMKNIIGSKTDRLWSLSCHVYAYQNHVAVFSQIFGSTVEMLLRRKLHAIQCNWSGVEADREHTPASFFCRTNSLPQHIFLNWHSAHLPLGSFLVWRIVRSCTAGVTPTPTTDCLGSFTNLGIGSITAYDGLNSWPMRKDDEDE